MNSSMDERLRESARIVNRKPLTVDLPLPDKAPASGRWNRRMAAACLSAIVCLIIALTPFSPRVLAYVINLLQSDESFRQVVDQGLSTVVGKKVTDQGITLSVENLYVDEGELVFDLIQSNAKGAARQAFLNSNDVQLFIDGEKLLFHSGGQFDPLPDGNYGGIVYYNVSYGYESDVVKAELPEQFNLTVKVDHIGDIHGDWTIELPVSRELSEQATRTFYPGVSHTVNGVTITVSKVKFTPLSTYIDYELTVPDNYSFADPSPLSAIEVADENGENMGIRSIFGEEKREGDKKTVRFTGSYETPKELPQELVIIPSRSVKDREDEWFIYYRWEAIEDFRFRVPIGDR